MNPLLTGILVYVLLQLAVGWWVARRIRNESDYLLAGRSLGPGLATFSFFATWFGAESCLNSSGQVYADGLSGGAAEPFGYGLCILLLGLVFAARLWRRGITTVADLFRERFSPGVEKIVIFITVPGSMFWAAAQIRAFGQVLDSVSGMGVAAGMLIGALVAITYTMSGGLRADVVTDLIQGIVIIGGLLVLVWVVGSHTGGLLPALAEVPRERLNAFGGSNSWSEQIETWAVPICGSVAAQELVSRALACRSPQIAQRSALLGGGLYLAVGLLPVMLGLIGLRLMPGLEDTEQFLPLLAREHLPSFLYIVFAGALVSAILSTIDSSLLAGAAMISHNLILPHRPDLDERRRLRINRLAVAGCGLVALLLAWSSESIRGLVETASAMGGGGLFVLFAVGQLSSVGGKASAYAALAASVLTWAGMTWLVDSSWPYTGSLLAAGVTYFAVAAFTRRFPVAGPG